MLLTMFFTLIITHADVAVLSLLYSFQAHPAEA